VYREVMRAIWFVCLAACSFSPAQAVGDGSAHSIDAPLQNFPDAPHVTVADAAVPPDACVDLDQNGVCDTTQWPCGALPMQPAATIDMYTNGTQTHFALSQIVVGTNQLWVGAPGSQLTVKLTYAVTDTACAQACVDQLEIGWVAGDRTGCLFDQTVSPDNGLDGNANTTMTLPMTPGAYDIRTNIGQNRGCTYNGAHTWWLSQPDDTRTIARVCVH
jgi:hypothetical protein